MNFFSFFFFCSSPSISENFRTFSDISNLPTHWDPLHSGPYIRPWSHQPLPQWNSSRAISPPPCSTQPGQPVGPQTGLTLAPSQECAWCQGWGCPGASRCLLLVGQTDRPWLTSLALILLAPCPFVAPWHKGYSAGNSCFLKGHTCSSLCWE